MRIQIPLLQVTTSDGFDVTCDVAFMSCATNGDASYVVNVLEEEQEDEIGEIASNSDLSHVAQERHCDIVSISPRCYHVHFRSLQKIVIEKRYHCDVKTKSMSL